MILVASATADAEYLEALTAAKNRLTEAKARRYKSGARILRQR
jgi:hypothetical protein